ncbi:MAG: MYXO-CTERM sorting domain-containing protein [Pseudomonadota bacterium]
MIKSLIAASAALFVSASAHAATTLDFTELSSGFQGSTSVSVTGATINGTGATTDLFRGAGGISNSICFINGGRCEGDGEIVFDSIVSNVSFDVGGFDPGDASVVSAVDSMSNVLASINIGNDGSFGFGALSGIAKLVIDDSSTGAGFVYGNVTFDAATNPVPVPAAAPLMLAGLGLLARRRRQKA